MIKYTKAELENELKKQNTADKLLESVELWVAPAIELFLDNKNAAALGFLARAAKKSAMRILIAEALSDKNPLILALKSDDFKLRKNAARLIGELKDDEYTKYLAEALNSESQRMVIPSMILALGFLNSEEAENTIDNYTVKPPKDESEEKHFALETEALRKAKFGRQKNEKHVFIGFSEPVLCILTCADKLSGALVSELLENGITTESVYSDMVTVRTGNIKSLSTIRCAKEILIFAAQDIAFTMPSLKNHIIPMMDRIIKAHNGTGKLCYRIELRGVLDKSEAIRNIANAINDDSMINSAADYELEIRIIVDRNRAGVYFKLFTIPDDRFTYRKGVLPASINPSVAAGVLRSVRANLKEDARVLDPFCGSGTMLFEREMLLGVSNLTGVDNSNHAVDIARENALAGNSRARFICNDCLKFSANRPYDELITNLPFGNRVGTHTNNEGLYAAFIERIPEWMVDGAVLILYTMEFTLLKKLIAKSESIELIKIEKTEAGGLMPGVFLCRVNKANA